MEREINYIGIRHFNTHLTPYIRGRTSITVVVWKNLTPNQSSCIVPVKKLVSTPDLRVKIYVGEYKPGSIKKSEVSEWDLESDSDLKSI